MHTSAHWLVCDLIFFRFHKSQISAVAHCARLWWCRKKELTLNFVFSSCEAINGMSEASIKFNDLESHYASSHHAGDILNKRFNEFFSRIHEIELSQRDTDISQCSDVVQRPELIEKDDKEGGDRGECFFFRVKNESTESSEGKRQMITAYDFTCKTSLIDCQTEPRVDLSGEWIATNWSDQSETRDVWENQANEKKPLSSVTRANLRVHEKFTQFSGVPRIKKKNEHSLHSVE